jgi:Bifunctional DNA primase/polymerase, N-terminal
MREAASSATDKGAAAMTGDLLAFEAIGIRELGANVISATDISTHAIEYAIRNWPVFPLNGKVPAIPRREGGKGVFDATTDLNTVIAWWSGRYAGCNIGLRVPDALVVIDVDPRNGGLESLAAVEAKHGSLPETLTTWSGRGDGGRHLYFRRPAGQLTAKQLGDGVDLKTSSGYVVAAPSIHPDTGNPYTRIDAPVATPPMWLAHLLVKPRVHRPAVKRPCHWHSLHHGRSIADAYGNNTSWAEILDPHGWQCLDAEPDADAARWLHPAATSACSATIRNGCLFVYSTNTPFQITESGNAQGYTKFRAYAVLNHSGDLNAAAKALSHQKIAI